MTFRVGGIILFGLLFSVASVSGQDFETFLNRGKASQEYTARQQYNHHHQISHCELPFVSIGQYQQEVSAMPCNENYWLLFG
jgi:hypothetical protein